MGGDGPKPLEDLGEGMGDRLGKPMGKAAAPAAAPVHTKPLSGVPRYFDHVRESYILDIWEVRLYL